MCAVVDRSQPATVHVCQGADSAARTIRTDALRASVRLNSPTGRLRARVRPVVDRAQPATVHV